MRMKMAAAVFALLYVAASIYFLQYSGSGAERDAESVLAETDGEIDLDELPLWQAIKQEQGGGGLVLVTFEDPNCPYCAELDEKLARLDNATIYTFLLPILSEDSELKSRQIWCARDRAAAWNDWMLKRRAPSGAGDCDTSALDENLEIGRKLGIQSVPYLLQAKE
ncbi:MAG: DsbC family protein [Azoarcus sp.]|nr:DsbC family protein [Azoarcus sp.]